MTVDEAAARLGIPAHLVRAVREHPAGHLADLRDGTTMLVSPTVARAYVPAVDDDQGDAPADETAAKAETQPAKRGRRG